MKLFLFDCGTRDLTASLGLLLLRFGTGAMMLIGHGLPKLLSFNEKKDHFPGLDFFPLSFLSSPATLVLSLWGELLCASLLILGLSGRFSAFFLGFTMVVAAFHVHMEDAWFLSGQAPSKEPALLYLIPCLALILSGPGLFSLDALIFKEPRRRKRW